MGRAWRPVKGAFLALGLFWGSWAVAVADIQRTFHLSDGALGVLLAIAIAIGATSSALVGHRAERWQSGRLLAGALSVWACCLVAVSLAPGWWEFAVLLCAVEVAGGCVDMAMNAAASRKLAARPGDLVRFHALFNTGALTGAAASGALLALHITWRAVWPGVGGFALVVAGAAWAAARAEPSGVEVGTGAAPGDDADVGMAFGATPAPSGRWGPLSHLRADGLLLFLAIFAVAEIAEGGVDTWGVLYLRTHLASGVLLGAGAYVVGQSVAALTRGAGGPLLGRLAGRRSLIVGSVVAATGIFLESTSTSTVLAAIGLALGAAGASLFWPLVMSQVTLRSSQATSAAGSFTAAGYIGWVAGAPLVGWVSDHNPALGLQVLAVLAASVAVFSLLRRSGVGGMPDTAGRGVGVNGGGAGSGTAG